jgi:hypothetical protein
MTISGLRNHKDLVGVLLLAVLLLAILPLSIDIVRRVQGGRRTDPLCR